MTTFTLWVRAKTGWSSTPSWLNLNTSSPNYSVNTQTARIVGTPENVSGILLSGTASEQVYKLEITSSGAVNASGWYATFAFIGAGTVLIAPVKSTLLTVTASQLADGAWRAANLASIVLLNVYSTAQPVLLQSAFSLAATLPPLPPVVTGSGSRTVIMGNGYRYQFSISDPNQNIASFTVLDAPAWLQWDNAGNVWGTPPATGQFTCRPQASDDGGLISIGEPFTISVVDAAYKMQMALQEAYASAPENLIVYTLEFLHPAFKDVAGSPVSVRVVRDTEALTAPLELSAPLDAGQWVDFIALHFEMTLPPEDGEGIQEVEMQVDNISRELMPWLEKAVSTVDMLEVIIRPYLKYHPQDGVQMPFPPRLIVSGVQVTDTQASVTARMQDISTRLFLNDLVDSTRFPTLGQ